MSLKFKSYQEGDYEKYIKSLTKENMEQLFVENFGGWSDEVSDKKFFSVLENGFVKLFFLENEFVGYVTYESEKNKKDSCLINDIHIVDRFRKRGIGKKILDFVREECLNHGCRQMKVFVFENNPSINFYLKMGFEKKEFLEKSNTWIMIKTF